MFMTDGNDYDQNFEQTKVPQMRYICDLDGFLFMIGAVQQKPWYCAF